MAKKIVINGVQYPDVPYVTIPLAEGDGDAKFVDTDGATAAAADLREGKTAWVNGDQVTGTAASKTTDSVTVLGKTVTVPAGIYDDEVQKSVADGSATPSAEVTGDELGDVESAYPVTITPKATVNTEGYITNIEDGATVTKYIQVEEKTVDPSMEAQVATPTEGKLLSKVTVNPPVLEGTATAADVMQGKTFYNTSMEVQTGTATVPVVGQDPLTKALEIA